MYEDRYNMTQEEAVFLAKRNIVDSIWKEANLEGIAVTFPQTQELYDGRTVAGLTLHETKAVNNLKHAWWFVLDNLQADIDIRFIRQINELIGNEGVIPQAGELRSFDVRVSGTDWVPPIPTVEGVMSRIGEVMALENPVERGLRLFGEVSRGQWFPDGNKRTAQLTANASLIKDGCGVLAVPLAKVQDFREALLEFYEAGDFDKLGGFLYKEAFDGISYPERKCGQPNGLEKAGRQAALSGRLAGAEAASCLQQPRSCGPRPGREGR
jgi:Fic family protein